jgi:hypothetical protein
MRSLAINGPVICFKQLSYIIACVPTPPLHEPFWNIFMPELK